MVILSMFFLSFEPPTMPLCHPCCCHHLDLYVARLWYYSCNQMPILSSVVIFIAYDLKTDLFFLLTSLASAAQALLPSFAVTAVAEVASLLEECNPVTSCHRGKDKQN